MNRKGIILAGGSGTRLHPVTMGISKHLLPIYDKPMVYYPMSVMMLAGIRDILLIATPRDLPAFEALFGDGSEFGISVSYAAQASPDGLAQAFLIGEQFLAGDPVALVLGDNIFYGQDFQSILAKVGQRETGATIFGYQVTDPERFGVVEFDENGRVVAIEEKPTHPRSDFAVTGLYFYDNTVVERAKSIRPSSRGELEITSLNNTYLNDEQLHVQLLGRGFAWLDSGTHDSLLAAGQFVHTLEHRQGLIIACLEEIAFRKGWIDHAQLSIRGKALRKTSYGQYLLKIAARSQR